MQRPASPFEVVKRHCDEHGDKKCDCKVSKSDTVSKHPGHADQSVHASRGMGSSIRAEANPKRKGKPSVEAARNDKAFGNRPKRPQSLQEAKNMLNPRRTRTGHLKSESRKPGESMDSYSARFVERHAAGKTEKQKMRAKEEKKQAKKSRPKRTFKLPSLGAGAVDAYAGAKRREAAVGKADRPDTPFNVYVPIEKVDSDERLAFGWAYVPVNKSGNIVVDRQGDFIMPADLEKAAYDYVETSRAGGVMHLREHHVGKSSEDGEDRPYKVATLVESMVFDGDKLEKMGLPRDAVPAGSWWVGYRVEDDATWDSVKKGTLKGFSIHGKGLRTPVGKSADAGTETVDEQKPPSGGTPPGATGTPPPQGTQQAAPRQPGTFKRKVKTKYRPARPEGLNRSVMNALKSKG